MYQNWLGMNRSSLLNTDSDLSVRKCNWCTRGNDCNRCADNDQEWSIVCLKKHLRHRSGQCVRKSRNIYIPPVWNAPVAGDFVGISQIHCKTRMIGPPHMLKKLWWYAKPFRQNTETWQTDRHTDRWTDRQLLCSQ